MCATGTRWRAMVATLVTVTAIGCGGGGGGGGAAPQCSADADCPSGNTCQDGACLAPVALSFAEPAGEVWTSGTVRFRVEVRGGPVDAVDLYDGATLLASLSAPDYRHDWNTSSPPVAEGAHVVTARARAGADSNAAEVTIHVDRTPPTIVGRVPAPGAMNVWSRDPITLVLDEPVAPVPAGAILLADDRGAIPSASTLSADGRTLSIVPALLPPVPTTMTLTLGSGITDLAGNALELPSPPRWSWDLPAWQELWPIDTAVYGGPTYLLAVDGAGDPLVAYADDLRGFRDPWRWSGSAWVRLPVPSAGFTFGLDAALSASGAPAFAWIEDGTARAALLGDGAWTAPAALNLDPAIPASGTKVVADPGGAPVVAWLEGADVHLSRWDGTSWASLGTALPASTAPFLSYSSAGDPVVTVGSWTAYAWAGGAWQPFAECPAPSALAAGTCRFAPDGGGYVAAVTGDPAELQVHVCRPTTLPFPLLGGAPLSSAGFAPGPYAMELTSSGVPLVAWIEAAGSPPISRILVERWTGDAWERLGGDLAAELAAPYDVLVATGPGGVVVVGVEEGLMADTARFHVFRYNR